jgi:hypothetical protein
MRIPIDIMIKIPDCSFILVQKYIIDSVAQLVL